MHKVMFGSTIAHGSGFRIHLQCQKTTGVADPDPGSGAFYTQESEKGILGSRSHIFDGA
jgi:hypothetical protein